MPRTPLHLASGTGIVRWNIPKVIRLVRYGCANRPFYHIVIMEHFRDARDPPIEQLGTYDEIPNANNEKLATFNFERIQFWLGHRARLSTPVAELLGLAGYLPIHPRTYMTAWRNRKNAEEPKEEAVAASK